MTTLEKQLLTSQIILLNHMGESFRVCCIKIGINNARYELLEYEECKLLDCIRAYLKNFNLLSDGKLNGVMDDIRDQLRVGNYINIINMIESYEPKK